MPRRRAAPAMRILIIGGSNSLLSGGYVTQLRQSLEGHGGADIVQLSVGATTSLSAIGRLHEHHALAGAQQFDVIVYEYGINDAGHFAPRAGGAESWRLCLHLLLKAAAALYPSAIFVPLVLAQRRQFAAAAAHPFYDAQIAEYAALQLNCLDIRAFMAALFMERLPDWLYRDEAHYDAPQATSIIGALLARRLLELVAQRVENVAQTCARMQATSPYATLNLMYVPAVNLQQFTSGPVQAARVENRLMRVDYLRMLPGSRLELRSAMFPLALFLKSDAAHDALNWTWPPRPGCPSARAWPRATPTPKPTALFIRASRCRCCGATRWSRPSARAPWPSACRRRPAPRRSVSTATPAASRARPNAIWTWSASCCWSRANPAATMIRFVP